MLRGQGAGLSFAPFALPCSSCQLLLKVADTGLLPAEDTGGLLIACLGIAATLFKPCQRGRSLGRGLLHLLALSAQALYPGRQLHESCFERGAFGFKRLRLLLPGRDEIRLGIARVAIPVRVEHPVLQAALNPCRLRLHLSQRGAGVCGFAFGITALVILCLELRVVSL